MFHEQKIEKRLVHFTNVPEVLINFLYKIIR